MLNDKQLRLDTDALAFERTDLEDRTKERIHMLRLVKKQVDRR